jgi:uncharacterized membrane protein YtjA (UPF0391 family)
MLLYLAIASWVVVFLAVALIAAVLGFTALAGTALNIAWILLVVGLILFVAGLGRRKRIEGTMPATDGATQVIEARAPAMPSRRISAARGPGRRCTTARLAHADPSRRRAVSGRLQMGH